MKNLLGSRLASLFVAFLLLSAVAFADRGYTQYRLVPVDGLGPTAAEGHNLVANSFAWIGPMAGLSGQAIRGGATAFAWNTRGTSCTPGRRCAPATVVAVRIIIVRHSDFLWMRRAARETFNVRFDVTVGRNGIQRASFGLGLRNLTMPLKPGDNVVVEVDATDADGGSVTDSTTYLVK